MPYNGPIEDRLAIRELQEMYGDAVIQKEKECWLELWHQDAVWEVSGANWYGKDAIAEKWDEFYTPYNLIRGNLTRFYSSIPGSIEIDGTYAVARVYVTVLISSPLEPQKTYYFNCHEEYSKDNGRWLIKRRSTKRLHPAAF